VLAVALPVTLHAAFARRVGSPFVLARSTARMPQDYRSSRPWTTTLSPRAARRLIAIYAGRLGFAMACSFIHDYGCDFWPHVRSVPEHMFFVSLLLGITVFHVPTARRVLGEKPRRTRGG